MKFQAEQEQQQKRTINESSEVSSTVACFQGIVFYTSSAKMALSHRDTFFLKKTSNDYRSVIFSFILSVFLNLWSSVLLLQRMYSKVNSKTCIFLCRLSLKLTIYFPFGPMQCIFVFAQGLWYRAYFKAKSRCGLFADVKCKIK